MIESAPGHLNIWLSKSFINAVGASNQMHRQDFVESDAFRCCRKEDEVEKLCTLFCRDKNLSDFRNEVIYILQEQVRSLAGEDLLPYFMLEYILNIYYMRLRGVPNVINKELGKFGARNMWHGFVPLSLSE